MSETEHEQLKWIVVFGNPVAGYTFVGPFEEPDDAGFYGEQNAREMDWIIAELHTPVGTDHLPDEGASDDEC